VLWLAFAPDAISANAKAAIEAARLNAEGLAISDITLLELATLVRKGRIHLDVSLESFLTRVEAQFVVLSMDARVCARSMTLPETYPKDPADRIIGATALVEGLSLLTADSQIRRSKAVRTIW
jgi:PIN domain nuclease of toxin-antitoxin system